METNASSVVTSLRALADLEDERIAAERERRLEALRAAEAAETRRREEEAERRRREEDERVAVTTAALERVRLEHEEKRRREERQAEAARVASERLREAEEILASRRPASRLGTFLRMAHALATVTLAIGLVLCAEQLREAHQEQRHLSRRVDDDADDLRAARLAHDELARNYGVALEAARNAVRPLPVLPVPGDVPTAAATPAAAPHRHDNVSSQPLHLSRGCDARDPLCGDL
jgi:hypothetical protein